MGSEHTSFYEKKCIWKAWVQLNARWELLKVEIHQVYRCLLGLQAEIRLWQKSELEVGMVNAALQLRRALCSLWRALPIVWMMPRRIVAVIEIQGMNSSHWRWMLPIGLFTRIINTGASILAFDLALCQDTQHLWVCLSLIPQSSKLAQTTVVYSKWIRSINFQSKPNGHFRRGFNVSFTLYNYLVKCQLSI